MPVDPGSSRSRTSGDLIADRRYAWGEAAARDGDFAAAADLFAQAVEVVPAWAAGWFALGDASQRHGDVEGAVKAFRHAADLDRTDALGATLRLAALGAARGPPAAAAYVRGLFDQYAPRFDTHLVDGLAYRGPALLHDAVEKVCAGLGRHMDFPRAIDLGCGTGLAARAFVSAVGRFDGVDLSPAMIEEARRTGLYARLVAGDIVTFLATETPGSADLVLAADVVIYIGDLMPLFAQAARVLTPGGLFALTLQQVTGGEWSVGADLRYAHTADYLRRCARDTQLDVAHLAMAPARRESGRDVPGLVAVLRRP